MQNRKNRWQYKIMAAVLMAVLALSMVGVIGLGVAQAANFGGISDNGTAAYMGIGTTTPQRPLHVFGNLALIERNADAAAFLLQRTPTMRFQFGVSDSDKNGHGFSLYTYPTGSPATSRLFVNLNGQVGINTITPDSSSRLNVVLNDNVTNNVAIYGTTVGGKTFGVGGTNEDYGSFGFIGGSSNQTPTAFYGIGAFGANTAYGTSGSLGTPNEGVYGYGDTGRNGIYGYSKVSGDIEDTNSGNYAGYFNGDVHYTGALSGPAKYFKIDHPLDPANKYLQHASVEAPYMMNIYNGSVTLINGEAVVQLPAYFEALNKDFQYQLTCVGSPAVVYIKKEIAGNAFTIASSDKSNVKVSWQVTGIRHDTWANANPLQVELPKISAVSASSAPALKSSGSSGKKGWADWSKPPAMSQ